MRIVVNKHWRVYLVFGCAGSLSLQPRITAYVVNRHALPTVPVYKINRIALLLCIFETTISVDLVQLLKFIIRRMAENGFAPPPREFRRHILSGRELKAESFKRCLHSVLRGVSL